MPSRISLTYLKRMMAEANLIVTHSYYRKTNMNLIINQLINFNNHKKNFHRKEGLITLNRFYYSNEYT